MCDEKHNPLAELNAYYGAYNTRQKSPTASRMGRGLQKVCLDTADTDKKIMNQANVLHKAGFTEARKTV